MLFTSVPHFLSNIICGLIPDKARRKKARVMMNSPMAIQVQFIRRNIDEPIRRLKTFVGYQARSLIIGVNDKWIFKFPLRRDNSDELAQREVRIVNALSPLSPIYIPPVQILKLRGRLVRKYEFVRGKTLRQTSPDLILKHKTKLARQIANFLYVIGTSDPAEIRDLKPSASACPGFLFGWSQGDVCDNFMIDTETMNVIAIIDWEDAHFGDISPQLVNDRRSPQRELMAAVKDEYEKIWHAHNKQKK